MKHATLVLQELVQGYNLDLVRNYMPEIKTSKNGI